MSSDAYSFDQATPAEAMEGINSSIESSAAQSSPGDSFSHVSGTDRSELAKRQRTPVRRTEREGRLTVRGSSSREVRSTSAPNVVRSLSVRKTTGKTRSIGGSPNDQKKMKSADEELDAKLKELEDQDLNQKIIIHRLEDENNAQRIIYNSKLQSIKDECSEFDQQYNHVLERWRIAEERSRTFESEFQSEARLFYEAREYLGELQQQFVHVAQEDMGAGLRIQELEIILAQERERFQSQAASLDQQTKAEFATLRDRADRVRFEASEAIAAKDIQQVQERELISDEAMKLKRRNDMLASELSFSQNDVIQATQMIHNEHRMLDTYRKRNVEEETAVRNLMGEMNIAESYLKIENARSEKLSQMIEEDRKRYEQRLSLVMTNPDARKTSSASTDLASKVEIQRLKHELATAESTLSIVPSNQNELAIVKKMKSEVEEAKLESEEIKEQGSYDFWKQRMRDANDERDQARKEKYEASEDLREERKMYLEEEREAIRRGEDVDRLRKERDEWRDYYDELMEGWTAEDLEHEEEEASVFETRSEAAASISGSGSKISRKEADKVVVPNWPRIHELEFWKAQVTSNIVAASGDLDHDVWTSWIAPTFKISPDIDGELAGSGDVRFNSVDVKLASALMTMMQNGGDQAREVLNEARLRMAKGCRGGTPTIMKGRQLLAMIVDSFRSASNTDLVFTIKHLYDLPYPGENDLVMFKSQWNEVLE